MPTFDDHPNLVSAPADHDALGSDAALREAITRHGAEGHLPRLSEIGRMVGAPRTLRWAEFADRYAPVLRTHDPYGRRVDEVEYHPGWHRLLNAGVRAGLTAPPWDRAAPAGAHTARAAGLFMWSQAESGHTGALSTTYAAVPALRAESLLEKTWLPRLSSRAYESALRRPDEKLGCLAGLALTERQAGSDLRMVGTRATKVDAGPVEGEAIYRLTGRKWFVTSPMSDVFLVVAQTEAGPTVFVLPRVLEDGSRNTFRLLRLKDKLGRRSSATAEVELEDSWAARLGPEGEGVALMRGVLTAVRHDSVLGAAGIMRSAVVRAIHHARHRQVSGTLLADKPLMQNVLADLALESEAATTLALRMAAAVDAGDSHLIKIIVPVAKYWISKRAISLAAEALEVVGGNGYVEEHGLARLLRDAPAHSLWEGGGNIDALDVLHTLTHDPRTLDVILGELDLGRGADARLDAAIDAVGTYLDNATRQAKRDPQAVEGGARWIVERLAVALQGSLLARTAPAPVVSAFLATRIAGGGGQLFGTLPAGRKTTQAIMDRALPA